MKRKVFSRVDVESGILLAIRDSVDWVVESLEFSWYSGGILNPDLDLVDVMVPDHSLILLKKLVKIKSCILWSVKHDFADGNFIFTFIRR